MAFRGKDNLIADLELAEYMIQRAKEELQKIPDNKGKPITSAYNGEYSLAKIKRNCVVARDFLNDVRKGCEW